MIVNMKVKRRRPDPISAALRRAIEGSELPLLRLQEVTGVQRASLSRFMRDERSLHLRQVDKLAEFLDLQLVQRSPSKKARK
jgi:hypothetical protein